ncbi:uncharacterized protein LOC127831689 isoform X2 [Dreissena polymorpha]|uniref:uncharacterized protein LOC127831689 isoform X2 n=1 Tax=Dreissena polymorpha TaxID=45954 RepID=UPI002263C32C|nr:uncharacterized protein LOC127831689 isoform X2 [Dreissena polymorpha]
MKKGEVPDITICRLLTLLLIVLVGVGSAANQVNGASLGKVHHILQKKPQWQKDGSKASPVQDGDIYKVIEHVRKEMNSFPHQVGTTQIRFHRLKSVCTEGFVKVTSKGKNNMSASGKLRELGEDFSYLKFVSKPNGNFSIVSLATDLTICLDKRWKPVATSKTDKKNLMTCEFQEVYAEDMKNFHYRAAVQTRHEKYLGFNSQKGMRAKDINNMKNRKKKDCYTFRKEDVPQDYIDSLKERKREQTRHKDKNTVKSQSVKNCQQTPGQGPPGVNFCDRQSLQSLISGNLESVRHGQNHKRHRNG